MPDKKNDIESIENIYFSIKSKIISRLNEFSQMWEKGSDADVFDELIFCILTPQSRAKSCWACVERLRSEQNISRILVKAGVRFHKKKARYIAAAKKKFRGNGKLSLIVQLRQFIPRHGRGAGSSNVYDVRDWLVQNIKGIGYKEASHFLRNIGFGENIAILDRHILKNLKAFGIIKEVPGSLSKKKYFEIEGKMKKFAEDIKIPMNHLDLVLWHKETGEVFK